MTTVKEILAEMQDPSEAATRLVEKAYTFAEKAHAKNTRYSGEPYFVHPAAVAKILASMGMDAPTIAAGLLHDAIEDGHMSDEEVKKEFGDEVLFLVEGVTKLGKHKYRGAERHAESLRRLLVATSADVRVLVIKLADRSHNMMTLEHVPEHKRRRIALETLEIYAPLADRLGMGGVKRDLEDLAFPYVDPDAYQHALEVRKLKSKESEPGLLRVQKELRHALARRGITNFRTEIRIKGLWSLHQKLKRKNDDITQIHDIAALRVVVPTIDDCYAALGVIHALWRPIPGGFKDYIAIPRPNNGYQSIHTNVLTDGAGIVEIQVRTEEMHRHAQFGVASHMSYKQLGKTAPKAAFEGLSFSWIRDLLPGLLKISKKGGTQPTQAPAAPAPRWLADLADAHTQVAGSKEFVEGLQEDFFSYRLFVFTPSGDVIDLPLNSTPIDFAYAIHSDLGNHMQGAKVNGKLVSFDTKLVNGDIVEVIKSKSAHPTAKWLDYVRTSMARKHIRAALAEVERISAPILPAPKALKRKKGLAKHGKKG